MAKVEIKPYTCIPPVNEHQFQTLVTNYLDEFYSDLIFFAIPNGAKLPSRTNKKGVRVCREGNKLKKEGMKKGVSDYFIAHPVMTENGFLHGLFIEFKFDKNKPQKEQIEFIARAKNVGYVSVVVYNNEEIANERGAIDPLHYFKVLLRSYLESEIRPDKKVQILN